MPIPCISKGKLMGQLWTKSDILSIFPLYLPSGGTSNSDPNVTCQQDVNKIDNTSKAINQKYLIYRIHLVYKYWLVVSTHLKNMKVNGKDYPIYSGNVKHVPNHQPECMNISAYLNLSQDPWQIPEVTTSQAKSRFRSRSSSGKSSL